MVVSSYRGCIFLSLSSFRSLIAHGTKRSRSIRRGRLRRASNMLVAWWPTGLERRADAWWSWVRILIEPLRNFGNSIWCPCQGK